MTLFGFRGAIATGDSPDVVSQGTCPDGYAQYSGVCVQVTSTAPTSITETNPSKLPPLPVSWGSIALLALLAVAGGATAYHFLRK